mgnify:CR=1
MQLRADSTSRFTSIRKCVKTYHFIFRFDVAVVYILRDNETRIRKIYKVYKRWESLVRGDQVFNSSERVTVSLIIFFDRLSFVNLF